MKIDWDSEKHKMVITMSKEDAWTLRAVLVGKSKSITIRKEFVSAFNAGLKRWHRRVNKHE